MSWAVTPSNGHTVSNLVKNERSYSIEGLVNRDVLIFKSMLRLLSHRTAHVWLYVPYSTELRVVAEGVTVDVDPLKCAQQVLTLGTATVKRQLYLQMPLHANELETALNQVGAMITPVNHVVGFMPVAPVGTMPMRMLRWPPAALLTTTARVRLATLMAGKPLTLAELQKRSRENLAVCTSFFDDLKQANLLVPLASATLLPLVPIKQVGLTDARLVKTNPVQPSLLERIRLRLGLQIFSASSQSSRS